MKKLDILVNDIIYGDMVHKLAAQRNIGLSEARIILSQMSFIDYRTLSEDNTSITPPSGNTLGPTTQSTQQQQANAPTNAKSTWTGKGPINVGMTVGVKGPNGLPVPGQVSQVDMGAKGVKVKNPTTGQDEWMNMDTLQPFIVAGGNTPQNTQPGTQQPAQPGPQQQGTQPTQEQQDITNLTRLRELAGIKEECSSGATGAGSIAIAPAAMGKMKKRQYPEESLQAEYTPKTSAKTIIGDTKPAQASGKLSADLAASGKVSAGRINNGRKRTR
jgi:hypothetical protein